jgi:hypothetical protein
LFFTNNPHEILLTSKIVLAIQPRNNYPSKSLLEGMVCGNVPIVTDVGTSYKIANSSFSCYLQPRFSKKELAQNIYKILSLNEVVYGKSECGNSFGKENFTYHGLNEKFVTEFG